MSKRTDVTAMLQRASAGDDSAVNRLLPVVYGELRALAESFLQGERPGHTLQATALVHEAYLRLVKQDEVAWKSRAHFYAVAAQAIRRILVDHARSRLCVKRGGDRQRVPMQPDVALDLDDRLDWIELDDALEQLARLHPRQVRIVELRFFGGMSIPDIGSFLGVSPRTVDGDWQMARAWLRRRLQDGAPT